jgi:putative heme-binding domain-containing protein
VEDDLRLVRELLEPKQPPTVQAAAVTALLRTRDPRALAVAAGSLPRIAPAVRLRLIEGLASRSKGVEALLGAIDAHTIAPVDIPTATRDKLLHHRDATLREHAAKSLAVLPAPARAKAMETFRPALSLPGDPAKGRPQFEKSCAACHALAGIGHTVGPDLAALTDKSAGYLLTAIVDPNAAVEGRFVAYQLDTTDGDTHVGLLGDESAAAVTLVQANGLRQSIPRAEIKSMSATKLSLMPEGLEQGLGVQDLADLIAFVQHPAAR